MVSRESCGLSRTCIAPPLEEDPSPDGFGLLLRNSIPESAGLSRAASLLLSGSFALKLVSGAISAGPASDFDW